MLLAGHAAKPSHFNAVLLSGAGIRGAAYNYA